MQLLLLLILLHLACIVWLQNAKVIGQIYFLCNLIVPAKNTVKNYGKLVKSAQAPMGQITTAPRNENATQLSADWICLVGSREAYK